MHLIHRHLRTVVVAALLQGAAAASAREIPLEDFFKPASFDEIKLSPDGTRVAALSTWKDHLNLYVIDLATKQPRMLTGLTTMDVANVQWVGNDRLVFTGREDGYPTGGIFAIDADGKNSRTLAESVRQQGSQGSYTARMTKFLDYYGDSTDEILVVTNKRRELDPDVARLNVRTGATALVARNPGGVGDWLADHNGVVRLGFGEEGREQFLVARSAQDQEWKEIRRWDFRKGTIRPLAFDEKSERVFVATSMDRDTMAVALMDPATGEISEEVFSDPTYDVGNVLQAPKSKRLLGFAYEAEKSKYVWKDPGFARLQTMLDEELPDTFNEIYSVSRDLSRVIVLASSDRDPGVFYLFQPKALTLEKLVARRDWLKPDELAEMRPVAFPARDGLPLHGYLTLPVGYQPGQKVPLIVNPHGGPWVRDVWEFSNEVQFFANRGYAVLRVNFRGSTGYGRKFTEAGYGQWGLSMQDDITDAVQWAVGQGYADPDRIAIYGASYGGYATMAGLAFTPELYRCGINYVGVTDIELLLRTIPQGWEAMRAALEEMTGKPSRDREQLQATSPMRHVDQIRVPVFFAYGELDDRVDMKHGTRVANALKGRGIPVQVMTRANEGHGYYHMENKLALYAAMETFLAKYMAPRAHAPADTSEGK